MELDRETRKDIESMIGVSVKELEKRIELKIDLIIQMLKNNDQDHSTLKEEQLTHRDRLNGIDIKEAQRPVSCPFRVRVENIEKKLDLLIYKTSIITGVSLGVIYFLIPILVDLFKNIFL